MKKIFAVIFVFCFTSLLAVCVASGETPDKTDKKENICEQKISELSDYVSIGALGTAPGTLSDSRLGFTTYVEMWSKDQKKEPKISYIKKNGWELIIVEVDDEILIHSAPETNAICDMFTPSIYKAKKKNS